MRSESGRSVAHVAAAMGIFRLAAYKWWRRWSACIGGQLGVPSWNMHRVLCRRGLNRLAWLDGPTDRVIRRIHTNHPGELVHVDVKKTGRIPDGGGWWVHNREVVSVGRGQRSQGMSYVYSAIDEYSRLAFSEIHNVEKGPTCADFFERSQGFFADYGIDIIGAALTDNAKNYIGRDFTHALDGIEH